MAYRIGRAHKPGKQKRNQLGNTTDPSSAHSTPSYSYYKLNEKTDIATKKSLTAETHSSTIFVLDNKPSVIIKDKYESNPY